MALDIDNLETVADVDNMDLATMDRGNTVEAPEPDNSVQEAKEKQAEEDVKEVLDEKKDDERSSVVFQVFGDVKEMGETPELLAESPLPDSRWAARAMSRTARPCATRFM